MTRNTTIRPSLAQPLGWALRPGRILAVLGVLFSGAISLRAQAPNSNVARILGMFDINGRGDADARDLDGDGRADPFDSDSDGLPDTWEVGGRDPEATDVPFAAPQAIVPGTPPVSLFSRRPVRTSATSSDTDGDGLSDFIEVFGLKFIDDNNNGVLDNACTRDALGRPLFNGGTPVRATDANGDPIGEWFDFNGDGMPSIGEFPARNVLLPGCTDCFDYDGFIFTDPANPDTDGDGVTDGQDNDPLINPRSFGRDTAFFPTAETGPLASDADADNDGLGNGMDLGNDVTELIDNPQDLSRVLELFRPDLLAAGGQIRVPEGLVDDLLGADWNGDGLFRLTDVQNPHFGLIEQPTLTASEFDLFQIENPDTDPDRPVIGLGFAVTGFPDGFRGNTYYNFARRSEQGANAPLPFQEILRPAARAENVFLPDPRIWTVLYAWRMPGFDIDGNGFIGYDGASFSGTIDVNGTLLSDAARQNLPNDPSSQFALPTTSAGASVSGLDGAVNVDCGGGLCGAGLLPALPLTLLGLAGLRIARKTRR